MISTATKLYPPIIDGKLPAQYGDTLVIPYRLNIVHDFEEIGSILLLLKSVYSNQVIILESGGETTDFKSQKQGDPDTYYAIFKDVTVAGAAEQGLDVGQYYKAQIAFKDPAGNPGNYSSAGVFKYTAYPTFGIKNLSTDSSNNNIYHYIGEYENKLDPAEKPYSYRFDFYHKNELFETSGDLINGEYTLIKDFAENELYVLNYTVKTVNNLTINKKYIMQKHPNVDIGKYPFKLQVNRNNDEGYNDISITEIAAECAGYYRLLRSQDQIAWDELAVFSLNRKSGDKKPSSQRLFRDNTIEHEVEYYYTIQQFDSKNNIYAEMYKDEETGNFIKVKNSFEDIFLSDGERQLKIRFNPKVSSYKITTLEQKTDTIGGKYPYFFRNGRLGYREIPVAGLISLLMDEAGLFIKNEKAILTNRIKTPSKENISFNWSTNQTSDNIFAERKFKMEVLNWLNNGKTKVFRSPIEGNAIVRLNNVSLSPEDQLGRMLHNFSCTAYEIEDYTFKRLQDMGLILTNTIAMEQDVIKDAWGGNALPWGKWTKVPAGFNARLDGMPFVQAEVLLNTGEKLDITVGSTGTYIFNLKENENIAELKLTGSGNEGSEFREQFTIDDTALMLSPTFTFDTYTLSQPIINSSGAKVQSYQISQAPLQWIGKVPKTGISNLDKILYMSIEINPLVQMDANLMGEMEKISYQYQLEGMDEPVDLSQPKMFWTLFSHPNGIPQLKYISENVIANLFVQYKITNKGEINNVK